MSVFTIYTINPIKIVVQNYVIIVTSDNFRTDIYLNVVNIILETTM